MDVTLNREKYIQILRTEGLSAALTALHHEIAELELQCFEGKAGWQPDVFEKLKSFRDFSRELWGLNVTINQSDVSNLQAKDG